MSNTSDPTPPPPTPIRSAEFSRAITRVDQAPDARPTIIFAGRSNVGKSSLINKLVNQKRLARTSNTPGRTQEIVYFDIEGTTWFVDLPGYGYARAPKDLVRKWGPMIERYLLNAEGIRLVILLHDARRDPAGQDFDLREWLERAGRPYIYAITKIDKLTRSERGKRMKQLQKLLELESEENLIPVSSQTGEGIDDLLNVVRMAMESQETNADTEAEASDD